MILTLPALPPFGVGALWQVMSSFATGPWAVITLIGEILAVLWYVNGVRKLAARSRRWPRGRTVAFLGGVAAIALSWQSGVALYASQVFTVHIIQHLAMMLGAPVLLALGAPVTLAAQTMSRDSKTRMLRLLRSRLARLLTNPVVAGTGNYGLTFWFFLDHGIVVSMDHAPLMDLVNCAFLLFGCLTWWPIVSPDYIGRRRYAYPMRVLMGVSGMPFDTILAITLLAGGASASIAPGMYSLASVEAGAEVFWILVMMMSGLATAVPAAQWLSNEQRRSVRADDLLDSRGRAKGISRYGFWGEGVEVDDEGTMVVPWARVATPGVAAPGAVEAGRSGGPGAPLADGAAPG